MLSFLYVVLLCLVFTGGLVAIGESHSRSADFPQCRRCGYNLTGQLLPSPLGRGAGSEGETHCPECGVALSCETVRLPRQVCLNAKVLTLGIALLTLALFMMFLDVQWKS